MLELLGTIFGSIFSGGATGIIGVVAQRFADYKNKQLDMQLEKQRADNAVALRRVDAEIMAQEYAARLQITTVETAGRSDVADSESFGKSFEMEPKIYATGKLTNGQRWLMVILDTLRGSIRPLLTIYLCVLTTMVYWQAKALLEGKPLEPAEALDLVKMIIGTILYLTTTCVLWWYGTRNKSETEKK
jgi:hypothetical protein